MLVLVAYLCSLYFIFRPCPRQAGSFRQTGLVVLLKFISHVLRFVTTLKLVAYQDHPDYARIKIHGP